MKVVLENLTKVFPPRSKKDKGVTAVDHFNFEIPDGQLIGLLGPSRPISWPSGISKLKWSTAVTSLSFLLLAGKRLVRFSRTTFMESASFRSPRLRRIVRFVYTDGWILPQCP